MKTIYKYPLEITDTQVIKLPCKHKILSVQEQNTKLTMWVLVDSNSDEKDVTIEIYGTGNPILTDFKRLTFIDTVQDFRGLVWHVFIKFTGVMGV